MMGSFRNPSQPLIKQKKHGKHQKEGFALSFRAENFVPGIIIGFIFGLFFDFVKPGKKRTNFLPASKTQKHNSGSSNSDAELKLVLVVRQDLRMGTGKIASQCAHAATGMYSELMQSNRSLLRRWEQCGQPKIVVACKNQQEMNRLQDTAETIGLPTFVVADAGRTEVAAGSKTVLAIGPGPRSSVDSVTGKQRLL